MILSERSDTIQIGPIVMRKTKGKVIGSYEAQEYANRGEWHKLRLLAGYDRVWMNFGPLFQGHQVVMGPNPDIWGWHYDTNAAYEVIE